jgi:Zn-dependent protease
MRRSLARPLPATVLFTGVSAALLVAAPQGSRIAFAAIVATAVVAGFALTVALHEAGHLMAAHSAGFRFVLFGAGPLRVRREGHRLRLAAADRWLPLGMAVSVPLTMERLERRVARMLLGGPLANLVTGGIALFLAAKLIPALRGGPPNTPLLLLAWTLLFTGVFGILLGALNLLPESEEGLMSDGARLRMLRRGGAESERWCAAWILFARATAGERPAAWNPGLLARATALPDASIDDGGSALLAYEHALDRGDLDEAERFLERARAAALNVPLLASLHAAEAAYFAARHRGDAVSARHWLEGARGGLLEDHARLRAEAALLHAEGHHAAAATRAREALAASERAALTPAGSLVAEREQLGALIEAADTAGGSGGDVAHPPPPH